jgi:hypothetical protein
MATYSGVVIDTAAPTAVFKRGITNVGLITMHLSIGITWPRRFG